MTGRIAAVAEDVETMVLRTARAARISPRRAALVLAERAETGQAGARIGIGSPAADAAALRGLARLYGARVKVAMLDELRADVEQVADEAGLDPGTLAAAMVRLIERGVVETESRAEVLGHLRRLAGSRLVERAQSEGA